MQEDDLALEALGDLTLSPGARLAKSKSKVEFEEEFRREAEAIQMKCVASFTCIGTLSIYLSHFVCCRELSDTHRCVQAPHEARCAKACGVQRD